MPGALGTVKFHKSVSGRADLLPSTAGSTPWLFMAGKAAQDSSILHQACFWKSWLTCRAWEYFPPPGASLSLDGPSSYQDEIDHTDIWQDAPVRFPLSQLPQPMVPADQGNAMRLLCNLDVAKDEAYLQPLVTREHLYCNRYKRTSLPLLAT